MYQSFKLNRRLNCISRCAGLRGQQAGGGLSAAQQAQIPALMQVSLPALSCEYGSNFRA